jgi:opacity protein-like surface antigen
VAGFEGEFGYAKNLLGEAPDFDSDVLTLMGNLMIAPRIGFVRPYGVIGLGLMRTTASLGSVDALISENNDFGWNIGGGLMLFFGSHVGIRGDIRVLQSLEDVEVLGFTLSDSKIKFGRYSGALMFVF